jgi:hypothetical protein
MVLAEVSDDDDDILQSRKSPETVLLGHRRGFGKPATTTTSDPISGLLQGLVILRVDDFLPPGYRAGDYPAISDEEAAETSGGTGEYFGEERSLNEILQEKYQKSGNKQVFIKKILNIFQKSTFTPFKLLLVYSCQMNFFNLKSERRIDRFL